jgi:hypothetical protein
MMRGGENVVREEQRLPRYFNFDPNHRSVFLL